MNADRKWQEIRKHGWGCVARRPGRVFYAPDEFWYIPLFFG